MAPSLACGPAYRSDDPRGTGSRPCHRSSHLPWPPPHGRPSSRNEAPNSVLEVSASRGLEGLPPKHVACGRDDQNPQGASQRLRGNVGERRQARQQSCGPNVVVRLDLQSLLLTCGQATKVARAGRLCGAASSIGCALWPKPLLAIAGARPVVRHSGAGATTNAGSPGRNVVSVRGLPIKSSTPASSTTSRSRGDCSMPRRLNRSLWQTDARSSHRDAARPRGRRRQVCCSRQRAIGHQRGFRPAVVVRQHVVAVGPSSRTRAARPALCRCSSSRC